MKTKSNLSHLQQLLLHTIPPPLDRYNQKTGAKTAPRVPKLDYFDGRAPQLSARVNHGTPAAGVIGHLYVYNIK